MSDDIRPGTFISDALHSVYVRPPQFMDVLKDCIKVMGFHTVCRPWYRTDDDTIPEICADKSIPEFNMLVHMETTDDEERLYVTVMLRGPGTVTHPRIETRYTINLMDLLHTWESGRMREQFMWMLKQILSQLNEMMCNAVFTRDYRYDDLIDDEGLIKPCRV